MPTTLDWLRRQDDAYLVSLLSRRPDLAIPAPVDFNTLAGRVDQAASVWRALEGVSRFGMEVLTALVLLGAGRREIARSELVEFLGPAVEPTLLDAELDRLVALALVRGTDRFAVAATVPDTVGAVPAGLGVSTGIAPDTVRTALTTAPERGRRVLDRLAEGPPVGAVDPDGPVAPVVDELIAAGLLVRRDGQHVELPREVALVLRGDRPLGDLHPDPVSPPPTKHSAQTVDGTGGGQSLDTLRRLRSILDAVTAAPPSALRAGGLGVRETRRLTRELDLPEIDLNLFFELLAAANLMAMGESRGQFGAVWASTVNAESWLAGTDEEAWALIGRHWLDLRRDPSRVGEPGANGKPIALLSGELSWLRGPAERRWVLQPLAELPPGSGWSPAQLGEVLGWRHPLRDAERRDRVIGMVVREATTLGVLAFDSLTSAGRSLLAGADDEVASRLAAALPTPGRTILVQADLTVVAPGRLQADLAEELALAAQVESAGSATVYRVTPASIRRALDRGRGAAELHRLFGDHSATPLPQALTYLIDDVARRHGVLRAGFAQSYLRCDDPLLIDQAVSAVAPAGILLRRLAPTVAITSTDTDELLTALRNAGLVPMAEDEFGAMITLEPRPKRLRGGLVTHQRWREPAPAGPDQLAVLVQRMRSADATHDQRHLTPAETVDVLRQAAGTRAPVWIEYVNAEGATNRRLVEPVALSGGSVAAWDRLSNQLRTFVLHRISSVVPADRS